jgi:ferredoxin
MNSRVEWGQPSIDAALCTSCGRCARICPTGSIRMKDAGPLTGPIPGFGCIACGHCMMVCESGAMSVSGRGIREEDVFKLASPESRTSADGMQALLEARRSIRLYANRPVEPETIERMIIMASTAPMGFPPTEVGVVVINGRDRVQEFAEDLCAVFKKWLFFRTWPGKCVMRLVMDKPTRALMRDYVMPIAAEILEARKLGRDLLFYHAPCAVLFHYPMKDVIDSTIACSFASLAAESLSLGTCIIGTVPPALAGEKKLKAKWGIPEGRHPSIAMILGYPSVQFTNGVRRRFASVKYV